MVADQKKHGGVSRRGFAKATALGTAALAAATPAGCGGTSTVAESSLPSKWDKEADVVVVGLGFAGQTAAISASDAGAKMIVLEKCPADTLDEKRHLSNSRVCGGHYIQVTNVEGAIKFLRVLSAELVAPDDMLQAWAEGLSTNDDFVTSLGGEPWASQNKMVGGMEHPNVEGNQYLEPRSLGKNGAGAPVEDLYQLFMTNISSRNIEIVWETPAQALYTDSTGQVVGVKATSNGATVNVKAKRAVILTTGGYENNAEMLRNFNMGAEYHFLGPAGHDGDGIKMAMAIGADLWHMKAASAGACLFHPDMPSGAMPKVLSTGASPYTLVDSTGKRFSNDHLNGHNGWMKLTQFEPETYGYPRMPAYLIFDETLRSAGTLIYQFPHLSWSDDNLAEIEKGWIIKADTIAELASQVGMDPAVLEETVKKYNVACEAGVDAEFGKPADQLLPLTAPPYHTVPMYPGGPNTQGGPRRNAKAQIMRVDGTPIPRLYSAGEMGSIYGMQYPGGGNVSECFAFGRIAGKNAAAETSLA